MFFYCLCIFVATVSWLQQHHVIPLHKSNFISAHDMIEAKILPNPLTGTSRIGQLIVRLSLICDGVASIDH